MRQNRPNPQSRDDTRPSVRALAPGDFAGASTELSPNPSVPAAESVREPHESSTSLGGTGGRETGRSTSMVLTTSDPAPSTAPRIEASSPVNSPRPGPPSK